MNLKNFITKIKTQYPTLLLILFVTIGFWFRITGISTNHSFWADEAFTAGLARDIAFKTRSIPETFSILGYQNLHILTMALSIKMFGASEWSARLPSVLWGTAGIAAIFFLAKKLSNTYGAIIGSFFYAFLQLNLAYSAQARPYAAIQTLLLLILISTWYWYAKNKPVYILLASFLAIIAVFYHYLAILYILILLPMYLQVFLKYRKKISPALWLLFGIIMLLTSFSWGTSIMTYAIQLILKPFVTNNITFVRELFYKQFGFMVIPAFFGGLYLFTQQKTKLFMIGIFLWCGMLMYLWTFVQTYHNVRYLLSLFGLICALFGVFWGVVFQKVCKKYALVSTILLMLLMFAGGNKIIRKPHVYYSPNMDLYGDVQIADYKNMYDYIKNNFDYKNIAIFNDAPDTESWYMGRYSDAYFRRGVKSPYRGGFMMVKENKSMIYGTLNHFLDAKSRYPSGILIVEDWHSILPEEIKNYAKQHMKLQKRFDGLSVANGDNWPLEVYSWGNVQSKN